jgi:putative membrane protein
MQVRIELRRTMVRFPSLSLAAAVLICSTVLAGVGMSSAGAQGTMVRDHYATLEDCIADWGRREHCDRVRSSGYDGGSIVFRGPAYPPGAREAYRRDALMDGRRSGPPTSPDPARENRSIGSVLEPPARHRPAPDVEDSDEGDVEPRTVAETLAGLPYFLAYYGIALMMLTLALAIYAVVTLGREVRLVAAGNAAAGAALAGVLVGFALPLAAAIARSEALLDMLVWGGAALATQLVTFVVLRLLMPGIARQIRAGQAAGGVFLGTLAAVLGLLSAAALLIAF